MLSRSTRSRFLHHRFRPQPPSAAVALLPSRGEEEDPRAGIGSSEDLRRPESHVSTSFFSDALKFCSRTGCLSQGEQLHSHMVKLGYHRRIGLRNHLMNAYVKCGAVGSALKVLDETPERDVVSFNVIVFGCIGKSLSLSLFSRMLTERVLPDHITFVGVLLSCIDLCCVVRGKQVHGLVIKLGHASDGFVGGAVVDLYARDGLVEDAVYAFDDIPIRDLVLWNVLVSCYVLNDLGREALGLFRRMQSNGVIGDRYTFCGLIKASTSLCCGVLGMQMHCITIKFSFDIDNFIISALIDMYAKTSNLADAHKVFNLVKVRTIVSWNAIIVGYGMNVNGNEPMELLSQMLAEGQKPDEITLVSILSTCANVAISNETVQVHAHAVKMGLELFSSIGNALIGAYAKCGRISDAFQSFALLSEPNVVAWTSLISGYAFHGLANKAVDGFERMLSDGIQPDGIAFLAVLSACVHAGLVELGLRYFITMKNHYHIIPTAEHYACLVDLLGRVGLIDDISDILATIPFKTDANVLGTVLSACKVHRNKKLGRYVANMLFHLEPLKPVNYVVMSNIYAAEDCWDDASKIRRKRCSDKVPGCSWTETSGRVQIFFSNNKSYPDYHENHLPDILSGFSQRGDSASGLVSPWNECPGK